MGQFSGSHSPAKNIFSFNIESQHFVDRILQVSTDFWGSLLEVVKAEGIPAVRGVGTASSLTGS